MEEDPFAPLLKETSMKKLHSTKESFLQLSNTSKVLVLLIILESIVLISLTIQRMTHPQTENSEKYSILMLVNSIFLTAFAIDGVMVENVFELFSFVFVSTSTLGFVFYQFVEQFQHPEEIEEIILWVRFLLTCLFSPLNLVFAYLAYKNFGWIVYKKIGASMEMTMMYTRYQQMIALLKLDVQIGINVVLIAGFFLYTTNIQLYLDIGVLCSTVFLAAIGWVGIRREISTLVILWFLFCWIPLIYVIFKFIYYQENAPSSDFFSPLVYCTGSLALLCRILLIVFVAICRRNFDKGLKSVFEKEEKEEKPLLGTITKPIVYAVDSLNSFKADK